MRCCWHEDSQSRPSFCDLIKKIVAIRNLYNGGKTLSINSINCDQFISADLSGSFDWESSTPISPNKQTKSEHASMFPTNCRKDLKNITSENNECIDSSNSTASLMSANKSSQFYVSENESVIVNIKEQDQSVQIDSSVGYQVQGNPQSLVIHKDDLIEPSLNQIASLFHTSSIDNRNIIIPDTKTDNLSSSSIFLQSHITKNVNDDTFIGNIFHESMTIADKQREKVQIDVDFKNNARCLETEL
ncbi:hypothetical protein LOD99_15581 [Oopsacas minuta]|uniref:Serine-threonine/tyrosine-protein kinase catalytic domain-containing protein n=1 Tax=Oopsacas minuta TaxID=111878 RepID=A0AAV7KA59_9METZ|nr:hypothetical protein LOD99_15581 [Oopsacas minuta]